MEKRKIYFVSKKSNTDFERYIEANKKMFFLEPSEGYEIIKISKPEELESKRDIYVYLFEVKQKEFTDKQVEQFMSVGDEREITYISVTL